MQTIFIETVWNLLSFKKEEITLQQQSEDLSTEQGHVHSNPAISEYDEYLKQVSSDHAFPSSTCADQD